MEKAAKKSGRPGDCVSSRQEAIDKMMAAASRILDKHTEDERIAWATKTVDSYIARGIIVVR